VLASGTLSFFAKIVWPILELFSAVKHCPLCTNECAFQKLRRAGLRTEQAERTRSRTRFVFSLAVLAGMQQRECTRKVGERSLTNFTLTVVACEKRL